ncbi:MAG: NADase-type glycan-binding domain-containing protein [Myxococcaceae bacterium]
MRRLCLLGLVVAVAPFAALGAPPPAAGYAVATGYFKKESRPTLYQPLNLLDGREITAWCSPTGDALSEVLIFGFKGIAKIDEIRVYTGNGFDDKTFEQYSRVKKLSIKGPAGAQSFSVADQRGQQSVSLNPPVTGERFSVEVLDIYSAEDLDNPVCITDLVFYSDGKPLNGPWLTPKLKYDRNRASVLGTWFSGHAGAPDRSISFFFDGTYRFLFDPFDPTEKTRSFGGSFEVGGGRIVLEGVPGKGKISARLHREGEGKGDRSLVFEGDLPEDLKASFRDRL